MEQMCYNYNRSGGVCQGSINPSRITNKANGGKGAKRGERRSQPYELTGFVGCVILKLLGGRGGSG